MGGIVPLQGAFYCANAKTVSPFNCFREENSANLDIAPYHKDYNYLPIQKDVERKILMDFNCPVLHNAPEYKTNCCEHTPTNRILTSMCSPERLLYIIHYALAYVKKRKEREDGSIEETDEKHIMRYQQLFASMAITRKFPNLAKLSQKKRLLCHYSGQVGHLSGWMLDAIFPGEYNAG